MSGPLLTTTSLSGVKLLGTHGQRSPELIRSILSEQLSERHANLFAEPEFGDGGAVTDWYASVDGTATRLVDLPEEEQAARRGEIEALAADVTALADRMRASDSKDDQRIGEALANALEIPDDDAIYIVTPAGTGAPQPVLSAWARLKDTASPVRGRLAAPAAEGFVTAVQPPEKIGPGAEAGTAPPVAPVSQAQPSPGLLPVAGPAPMTWPFWLGWLALLLLTLAILWLLIAPCGLRGPSFLDFCPAEAAEPSEDVLSAELESRIARLQRRLAEADRDCAPLPAPPVPEPEPAPEPEPEPDPDPEPEPEPEDDIDRRLNEADAQGGDLEIALSWDSRADLDLMVTCPSGGKIWFGRRNDSTCRGALDVDANAALGGARTDPVEQIVFDDPEEGTYLIEVIFYRGSNVRGPHDFNLRIRFGERVESFDGTVTRQDRSWRTRYEYRR